MADPVRNGDRDADPVAGADRDHRDTLPAELDVTGPAGATGIDYAFPNNRRRRVPGMLYLAIAAMCFVLWAWRGDGGVLVNGGFLGAAVGLAAIGAYHLAAGWDLAVDDTAALVAAVRQTGFPVGHASAQLGWTGLRSRPTWRILLYSAENPPLRRGLVLVDGVNGDVVGDHIEDNPEDWSEYRP